MEVVKKPKGLRYGSILSLMDMLDGAKELTQLAAKIASSLDSSLKGRRNTAN